MGWVVNGCGPLEIEAYFGPNTQILSWTESSRFYPIWRLNNWFVQFNANLKPIMAQKLNWTRPGSSRQTGWTYRSGLIFKTLIKHIKYFWLLVMVGWPWIDVAHWKLRPILAQKPRFLVEPNCLNSIQFGGWTIGLFGSMPARSPLWLKSSIKPNQGSIIKPVEHVGLIPFLKHW